MRPDLLDKQQREKFDSAAKTFVLSNKSVQLFSKESPHPEKTSDTLLH